jgi:hypothetical protein
MVQTLEPRKKRPSGSKPTVFSELPDIPFGGWESPFRRGICRSLHGDWVDRDAQLP